MEDLPKNEIYFIFCQKGPKCTIAKIDTNFIVKSANKLKEENANGDIRILYHIKLSNDYNGRPFTLTLINESAEYYICYISCKKNEKFKYNLVFESIKSDIPDNIKQIKIPFYTQFEIFKVWLNEKSDVNLMNLLYLNTIDYISENKTNDINQKILLLLFMDIYGLKDKEEELNKNDIIKYFFTKINFNNFFEDCISNKFDSNKEITLDELKMLKNIRNYLIERTGNKEEINENIDLFIMFYLIYIKPEYFFDALFDNEGHNYEEIKNHLLNHKKIFKDFNSDILSPEFFLEAPTYESMELVIKGFIPNMLELLKLFAHQFFYMKFGTMHSMLNKSNINILDLVKPKKSDETEEFREYFEKIYDNFLLERYLPINFDKNFYITYCKLFKNENYKKIYAIYEILGIQNKRVRREYKIKIENEIIQYYHDTGIYLIQQKVLFNKEMLKFLENDELLSEYEENREKYLKSILDIISIGIHFDKNESKFINDILNNGTIEDFNIKKFFGNLYNDFIKKIFNKLTSPEDLLNFDQCYIRYETPEEVLENFVLALEKIWTARPISFPENIENFIAQLLSYSSAKIYKIFDKVYVSLENKIPKDILLSTYCTIIMRDYPTSQKFRDHIIEYIENNCGNDALSVWYKLNITGIDNEDYIVTFLENNLKDEFIVKVEDFIDYINKKNEKILLFLKLRRYKYFYLKDGKVTETSYYKESLKSKDNLKTLKYKDALYIHNNLIHFLYLFANFCPIEQRDEENEIYLGELLIQFSENFVKMKKFYNSLETIYNFWENFFQSDKKEEINKLRALITLIENSKFSDFTKIKKDNLYYEENFLKEAQNGEQLKNSLFYMGIYNYICLENNIYNEKDRYEKAKQLFDKLKNLGNDSNFDSLDNELKDILIKCVSEKPERLNNELNFIKNYFFKTSEIDKESKEINNFKYNNFNVHKIKRQILKLVNNQEKDFEEDIELNEENNINIIENENYWKKNSQEQINEEKIRLIEEINKLGIEYIKSSRKIKEIDPDFNQNLRDMFEKYFRKLFDTNFGFAKLDLKNEFNEKIIKFSKKIYMNNVDIDLLSNDNLILISEFFDILEAYEQNGNDSKKILLLLQKMNDIKGNYENNAIINWLNNLFSFIKENIGQNNLDVQKNMKNLLIKILIKEVRKKEDHQQFYGELLDLIFSPNIANYQFLFGDLAPFIDKMLGKDFTQRLNFGDNRIITKPSVEFYSKIFQKIDMHINNNIELEEMFLFYFESKISKILDTSGNEDEIVQKNNSKYYYLQFFIDNLGNLLESRNSNNILKLYSIAYIKCYYSKLIRYLNEHNQDILNKNFFEEIYDGRINKFKISMMIYVLKLAFEIKGDINEFETDMNYRQIFEKIKEILKDKGYLINSQEMMKNEYGFDFIILPNNNEKLFFEMFDKIIEEKRISFDKDKYNNDFIETIKKSKDIDLLYCLLLNIFFSFYHYDGPDDENEKFLSKFSQMINNKKIEILNNNELLTEILQLLINKNLFNEKIEIKIHYHHLLCILISFRYVINIAKFNNKDGLFYNLIVDPKNTFSKNKDIFNIYLNEENKEKREIKYLTYKIIKYIIYSHLFLCTLLGKISKEEAYEMIGFKPRDDEKNYLFIEFDEIKDNILNVLGIKNIIIFMNSIFDETANYINTIKNNCEEKEFKEIEKNIDEIIKQKLSCYSQSKDKYYNIINKYKKNNNNNENDDGQKFYDILYEKKSFYDNEDINKEFPYISYLTYTNFCTFDDFKKQYLNENDAKSYPVIDCIIKEKKILKIIEFIPKLNEFVNNIYNELLYKNISRQDADKDLKSYLPNLENLNEFNNSLKQILDLYDKKDFEMEINENSKISEVINLDKEDNKMNKIYSWIIEEYNKFLESTNIYSDNQKYIKSSIIQNCTPNDYISFKSHNGQSVQERLTEIIYLYSKRNRRRDDRKLNIYDGGKIIYDYELIEEMLEKEFILCKRKFRQKKFQKYFIFPNEIFSNDRSKILIDLNEKYPQAKINSEDTIKSYLEKGENNIKSIYYNCLYLIIYLMIYLKDEKLIEKNTSIEYLIKLMEKENNKIINSFKDLYDFSNLNISQIFALYEIIEINAFKILTKKINEEIQSTINTVLPEEIEKEIKELIEKNSLLKEAIIIDGIKKYIIRYFLGDNNGIKFDLKSIKFNDIFKKMDIWGKKLFNDVKFKEESEKLCNFEKEKDYLLIYFYKIIFVSDENPSTDPEPDPDTDTEDDLN